MYLYRFLHRVNGSEPNGGKFRFYQADYFLQKLYTKYIVQKHINSVYLTLQIEITIIGIVHIILQTLHTEIQ